MAGELRRLATGHDERGAAVVQSDDTAEQILKRPIRAGQPSLTWTSSA